MRALPPILLGLSLLLPGCSIFCPQPEVIRLDAQRDSPMAAFATFREALRSGASEIVHESLSPAFKEKYDVPGLRTFKLGYQTYRSDFDELAGLLDRTEVKSVRYGSWEGRRVAILTLEVEDASGEFVVVDTPTWNIAVEFEGYPEPDRQTYPLSGRDFSDIIAVKDGRIYVGPLDATESGVMDPDEILSLSVRHQWYLLDIQKLVNVRPLLERMRAVEGAE